MKKKILIIEDDKNRIKQFKENFINADITFSKTVKESIKFLKSNDYDMVFFDHDLGRGGDAIEIVKWLTGAASIGEKRIPKKIYIHSANPVGAKNIQSYLKNARKAPMIWKKEINFGKI